MPRRSRTSGSRSARRRGAQLTHGKEPASDPVWSPDGTRIAYVAHFGGEQPPEKDADAKTKRAWEYRVRTITRRKYKHDGDGFWDGGYDHLFVIPAAAAIGRN